MYPLRRPRRFLPRAVRPSIMRPLCSEHAAIPQCLVGHKSQRLSVQERCEVFCATDERSWAFGTSRSVCGCAAGYFHPEGTAGEVCRACHRSFLNATAWRTRHGLLSGLQECTKCTGIRTLLPFVSPSVDRSVCCGPVSVMCLRTGPVGFQCTGRLNRPFRDTGCILPQIARACFECYCLCRLRSASLGRSLAHRQLLGGGSSVCWCHFSSHRGCPHEVRDRA